MKRKSVLVSSLFLSMVLTMSVGCAKKPSDAQISSDIQSKFGQDSGLSAKQLSVQSANGVVTLNGTVDNDAQRQAASRQAASVAGVKEVVNNLQVGSTTAATTPQAPPPDAQPSNSPTPPIQTKPPAGKSSRKSHGGDSAMADNSQPSDAGQMSASN